MLWFWQLEDLVYACSSASVDRARVRVCAGVCVMIEVGYYLASSMPQGEMTAGYAHAADEGEASVDVSERCSSADRVSLHSHHPTPYLTPTLTPSAHSNWATAITNHYRWKPLIQISFTEGASQLPALTTTASTEGLSVSAFS